MDGVLAARMIFTSVFYLTKIINCYSYKVVKKCSDLVDFKHFEPSSKGYQNIHDFYHHSLLDPSNRLILGVSVPFSGLFVGVFEHLLDARTVRYRV